MEAHLSVDSSSLCYREENKLCSMNGLASRALGNAHLSRL